MIFFLIILDDLRCFPLFLDFFLESIGTIWYYHFLSVFGQLLSPWGSRLRLRTGGRWQKGPCRARRTRAQGRGAWWMSRTRWGIRIVLVDLCSKPKPFASNLHQHIFLKVYVYIRHLMSRSAVGPSDPAGFFEFNLI